MNSNRSPKMESCRASQIPTSQNRRARSGRLGWLPTVAALSLLLAASPLWAAPTTAQEAQAVARGWLQLNASPFETATGGNIAGVETFADGQGQPAYYIVSLASTGFVIVSADDQVEPVVGFVPMGHYDPSPTNPLGALVSRDLPGRLAAVRTFQATQSASPQGGASAQAKWQRLKGLASFQAGPGSFASVAVVSDIRVSPLLQSAWDQDTAGYAPGAPKCYSYYTPSNYVCGCVATAMAQLMRFWQFPTAGIGAITFPITVSGIAQTGTTRGGDGLGGPYVWGQMPLAPTATATATQCQAIGALCYDAGLSVNMDYSAAASGASNLGQAALKTTFGYANAIRGYNNGNNLSSASLLNMINPNLDAGCPVLLGITGIAGGHAIIADGYGYDTATLYHHLNMGWSGSNNAWYNLPNIDVPLMPFTTIDETGYNIYKTGTGEIISGRVTDQANKPISGAIVTAVQGANNYTATTNAKGVYALTHLPSSTIFTVSALSGSYTFTPKTVTTGLSMNMSSTPGNRGGTDFAAVNLVPSTIQFSASTYSVNRTAGIATIDITRTGGTATTATVNYTTADSTALAGTDYTTASGTVIFAVDETVKTITVLPINTVYRPGDKTVNLSLSNPTGAVTSLGTPNTAVLTIVDNQAPPTLAVADVSASETDGATTLNFQVNLTLAMSQAVTVHYQSVDGTAKAGTDYTAVNGTLTIPAGQSSGVVSVPVTGNTLFESDKTMQIALSSPTGATISRAQGQGTILNDDPQPSLSIEDATSTTSTLVLTVRATRGAKAPMTVIYQTADATALAGTDYTATGGTLTIPSGQTTATISVPLVVSSMYEPDKTILVNITNPTVATLARGQAKGTIRSALPMPSLTIEDATGTGNAVVFTVRLSAPSKPPVSVRYQTADETAVAGRDYTAANGTLVVPAGQTTATISVPMTVKTNYEADKTFWINLSVPKVATIARAQAQGTVHFAPPSLGFDDVSDLGSFVSFGLRLSTPSVLPVTLQYETADGTAAAGTYYSAANGVLTIPPGQTITTIIVPILGRAKDDRTVLLKVTGVTNASASTPQVTGVIRAGATTGQNATPTNPITDAVGCGTGVGAANMMAFYALCWAGLAAVRWGRRSM